MLGEEIASLKHDLTSLQNIVSASQRITNPQFVNLSSFTCPDTTPKSQRHIVITTWNCRGLRNSTPYINQLFGYNMDVIALCEHWLWPFDLPKLDQLHPDYIGFGRSDKRLTSESNLTKGCGGVGLIWKKSIAAVPLRIKY